MASVSEWHALAQSALSNFKSQSNHHGNHLDLKVHLIWREIKPYENRQTGVDFLSYETGSRNQCIAITIHSLNSGIEPRRKRRPGAFRPCWVMLFGTTKPGE